jgi:nucleoside-diphosphate-sugar epimerase
MTTLVTGANGFIGAPLCERLRKEGIMVREGVRAFNAQAYGAQTVAVGDISSETDWGSALKGVRHVVHLAARVHVMNDGSSDPLTEFRLVNVLAAANLARQAAKVGVKRFVFLSSIKVNGEFTKTNQPFTADDAPAPVDPYAVSKFEAEQILREIAAQSGMDVVVIRTPLVYGAGVKGNFGLMVRWLVRGVPLPLAAVTENRRSLVALDNLIDMIVTCLNHPAAANQTFLVSDVEDISTADLLIRMGVALGRAPLLFSVHTSLLKLGAVILNKFGTYQNLCESLQIDIAKTRRLLDWSPPVAVDDGLRQIAKTFSE